MKNKLLSLLSLFLLSAPNALAATCTYNGEEIPCDQMPMWIWVLMGSFFAIGLFIFVFWLWMLIDAIKYQEDNKVLWLLLILLTTGLGAIVYYFAAKKRRGRPHSHQVSPSSSAADSTPMGATNPENYFIN